MRAIMYTAALGLLLATTACSTRTNPPPQEPFDTGLRQSFAQPTSCSPADQTCGAGLGNPAVQSPVQKRLIGTSPGPSP